MQDSSKLLHLHLEVQALDQHVESRVVAYTPTTEANSASDTQPVVAFESIFVMSIYKDKNHEELRWEDFQLGDKELEADSAREEEELDDEDGEEEHDEEDK
ncbi:hypothetical protein QYF36_001461 [Acer negundo]|nr:hypothetical protein QYF36_001461 [Acer negundo]